MDLIAYKSGAGQRPNALVCTNMLHRYKFANFQSFLEPVEVVLTLNGKVPPSDWEATSPSGQRLTTVLGVVGPNGAGKTALLKPIVFAAWFMRNSFQAKPDSPIPITPHFAANDDPVEFELEADDEDGRLWRYVLRVTRERAATDGPRRDGYRLAGDAHTGADSQKAAPRDRSDVRQGLHATGRYSFPSNPSGS